MEYQIYGLDENGKVTHAGTRKFKRLTRRAALQDQREWELWRETYLSENPGEYPLRHSLPTKKLYIHPVGDEKKTKVFDV